MSTSQSTLPPTADPAPRRRRRWPVVLVAFLILVAGTVIAASLISAPYTELVPGDAQPVASLITVPPGRAHPIKGEVLLTDVGVQTLKYIQYYWTQLFSNPDNTVVPTGEVTYNLPESEFDDQGTVDMEESQLTAKSVALRQLGYSVPMPRRGRDHLRDRPLFAGLVHAADRRCGDLGRRSADDESCRSGGRRAGSTTGRHRDPARRFHRPADPRP